MSQIYSAQKVDSLPGDFCELISESLKTLKVHMTEDQIAATGVKEYKSTIKGKVMEAAFLHLKEQQQTHSKVKHIKYEELRIQPYLCSPLFSRKEQSILFRLRSRTIPGIKKDFEGIYKDDMSCPVCPPNMHLDTIPNLVNCPTILAELRLRGIDTSRLQYQDIFSTNVGKQHEATIHFMHILESRERILSQEKPPTTAVGPVHIANVQSVNI